MHRGAPGSAYPSRHLGEFHFPSSDSVWERWWGFQVGLTVVVGILALLWFLVGGFRDLFEMIGTLRSSRLDTQDDGTVPETKE